MRSFVRFPIEFYIEPPNDCNLGCSICPRKSSKKKVGYMSYELFCRVIDQLAGQNVPVLGLLQCGEPLLHPRIIDMIRYAKSRGMVEVGLATNGTLLSEDLAESLIASGLDLLVASMDNLTAEKYCPDRKSRRLFSTLDQNILRLINRRNRRRSRSPKVYLQIIDMPSTHALIPKFREKWEGVADKVVVKEFFSWGGYDKLPSPRLICANLLGQDVVQWDGDVSFCCLYVDRQGDSSGIIGNAARSSLESIFMSQRRREIIEAQLGDQDIVPYCRECQDRPDFLDRSWKRASSFNEHGK